MGRDAGRARLDPDVPDLATIRRELVERFPGIHMEVSGLYAQNRYGPFSYAIGRTRGGTTCLYAWQRIANEARVFRLQRGAITWRLRICDPATGARELLLLAYGLTINGYFLSRNWNPYGEPPAPDPRLGVAGETMLPEQRVDPTVVSPDAFGARRAARVRAPARARQAAPAQPAEPVTTGPLNEPLPGAAVVPRPQDTILADPEVETSNLPQRAPRPNIRLDLPEPPRAPSVPSPRTDAPTVSPPNVDGPRIVAPRAEGNGAPSVRIVDFN
jgi:hypothetical protein